MLGRDAFVAARRCLLRLTLTLSVLMSVGCSVTEVVVVVDGPTNVIQNARMLQIQVQDANGAFVYDEVESVAALGTNAFPVTLSLTPSGAEDAGFGVLVRMTDQVGQIRAYVKTSFVSGKSVRLDIPLFSACRRTDAFCYDMGQQTCTRTGSCGSPDVDPAVLPEWTGSP